MVLISWLILDAPAVLIGSCALSRPTARVGAGEDEAGALSSGGAAPHAPEQDAGLIDLRRSVPHPCGCAAARQNGPDQGERGIGRQPFQVEGSFQIAPQNADALAIQNGKAVAREWAGRRHAP